MIIRQNLNKLSAHNSKPDCEGIQLKVNGKYHPLTEHEESNGRLTVTHASMPTRTVDPAVSNLLYERPTMRKDSTNQHTMVWHHQPSPVRSYRIPASSSSIEIKSMDFRPLITYGRRRFNAAPFSSSMIIVKKKSPCPVNTGTFETKPLMRSIPVDIISSDVGRVFSSTIPSSLSHSSSSYSSSSSTSASSTNVGTVFLPIQVTRSQKNNNSNDSTFSTINEGHSDYRYVQRPLFCQRAVERRTQPARRLLDDDTDDDDDDDDADQSTGIPSPSRRADADDHRGDATSMMDSQVLRLIRRYDPVSLSTAGVKSRRPLENTRTTWHTVTSEAAMPESSPFLSCRALTTTREDETSIKTPRLLQRQTAVHELTSTPSLRPILKYGSPRSRAEYTVLPHRTEPLANDIDAYVPSPPQVPIRSSEHVPIYPSLATTGTRRVCSALSKSELNLRLRQDSPPVVPPLPFPVRPPSPPLAPIDQHQEREFVRPLLVRSKSSIVINHDHDDDDHDIDDFDEMSAPIVSSSSYVNKLKQLFTTKSSLNLTHASIEPSRRSESIDSSLHRRSSTETTTTTIPIAPLPRPIEPPVRAFIHNHAPDRAAHVPEVTTPSSSLLSKRPILRSHTTIESSESAGRPQNSTGMPSSELSYDAYRFRRSNGNDPLTARPKNIAKVEPYSISTHRPLYQSSATQPITVASTITVNTPSKARVTQNSMGHTPTNSSASSSAGSLAGMMRQPKILHSDFLEPNPAYSARSIPLPSCQTTSQSLSHSSSYTAPPMRLSESLSHGSLHRLPVTHTAFYDEPAYSLTSSRQHPQEKHRSSAQGKFHSSIQTSLPSSYHDFNRTLNNTHQVPATFYHYRPLSTAVNNHRQPSDLPTRSRMVEQQQQQHENEFVGGANGSQQQQQSRRRFQRRKQMKRSKSVDLYQEPSSFVSPSMHAEPNGIYRQPRSISRECLTRGNITSSSSSSSIPDHERFNRAGIPRYKSLDSMAFNNLKPDFTAREKSRTTGHHRRATSKPPNIDFDSDDSVCGIPKPRKLCTSSQNAAKSDGTLLGSSSLERDHRDSARAISITNPGSTGASTGITNAVRRNETVDDRTYPLIAPTPSGHLSTTTTTNGKRDEEDLMQHQQTLPQSKVSLAESQFYARTSMTPNTKRTDVLNGKSDGTHSSTPIDDTFHDATDDLNMSKDQTVPSKVSNEADGTQSNQYLFTPQPTEIRVQSSLVNVVTRPLSGTMKFSPFERLRPMEIQSESRSSEDSSLKIFDRPKRADDQDESTSVRPFNASIEPLQGHVDETNDSSTSTPSRSIHLPVEKQRGLSEIIRKRNSRNKVEDYKRSYQKPSNYDDEPAESYNQTLSTSTSDQELKALANQAITMVSDSDQASLSKAYSAEIPVDLQGHPDRRARMSIERLNVLLSNEEISETPAEIDEAMSVSEKKNLFETFTKDLQFGGSLPRSKSVTKKDTSSALPVTKKYAGGNQRARTEIIVQPTPDKDQAAEKNDATDVFDDDTSKLTFKEKMTLFNKKNSTLLSPSPSLKNNRSRLTQPITAEEVQAAVNLTPGSSSQHINAAAKNDFHRRTHANASLLPAKSAPGVAPVSTASAPHAKHVSPFVYNIDEMNLSNADESENRSPLNSRVDRSEIYDQTEAKRQPADVAGPSSNNLQKVQVTSARKTPTLKYAAKKNNADQEQRAKTVDIVRLKTEPIGPKKNGNGTESSNNRTNGNAPAKSNQSIITVLKSDTVSILKPDDHLDDFFAPARQNLDHEPAVQLNTDDLNLIAENTVRLQSQAPRARPPRRQQQGAKNPLRQIQVTMPAEDEYTEVHTNVSEQEVRRLKRAQIAETAGVAQEALAALTAGENFAAINLRKVNHSSVPAFGFEPYKDFMLMLIKGHRRCSLRLVNPTHESINEGDCYLLLTPLKVFGWIGRAASALKRTKTTELIDYLKQHRDFGLRSDVKFFVLDQAADDTENDSHAEFRDALHGEVDSYKTMDEVTDDEFYEENVAELNRVYRVENDVLMPLDEFCFQPLAVKMLDENEVFVFDFGSELYVWNGKYADKTKRVIGLQLAQQLWNDAYDFSECAINPFDPLDDGSNLASQTGTKRPEWCLFGKLNQNVETLLFKGKFADWSSDLNDIKLSIETANNLNRLATTQRPTSIVEMLKPADAPKMLQKPENPVNMILEQASLGRGRHWYDPVEMRGHDVHTVGLSVWHVSENERHELAKSSCGQFFSDDVYIVRWRYKLIPLVTTDTNTVRKAENGRDRVAYWIWQGMNASPNEKGISVLMTAFFDEEKGPHIHVIQEREEAAFLQLFDGTLTIHMGRRNHPKPKKSNWHLFVFLGEMDVETHWWELNVHSAHLRSRTSFLLMNNMENVMIVWHGCATTQEQRALANRSAMKLRDRCPEEFRFHGDSDTLAFYEMSEGDETDLFWQAINEPNHERRYNSLLNARSPVDLLSTMRIFHLSSLHGPFVAHELVYILRSPDRISPFPFTQSDLYELHQPALCLIDAHTELYIWQGWNDVFDDDLGLQLSQANLVAAGPRDIRFTAERRCAFRTAVDYCQTKFGSSTIDVPCSIVYAGLEPVEFINLFPKWTVHMKARQQNLAEGKTVNQKDSVLDVLNQLCRERYTLDELRARPLPEGVDPSKIESYLSDDDFQSEFRMTKDEFYALPYWKQTNVKKPLGFF